MRNRGQAPCRVLTLALLAASVAGAPAEGSTDSPSRREEPLRVVAFYSSTCAKCQEAIGALAAAEQRWGGRVRLERHDTSREDDAILSMFAYEEHYGSEEPALPKVFVGGQYVQGYERMGERLNAAIEAELAAGRETFSPGVADDVGTPGDGPAGPARRDVLAERLASWSVGTVAVAGLIDGVNPCAFTTIVFLVSMLAYLGKSRREVLTVGVGFTAGVFVTYLLLGVGLMWAIKRVSVTSGVARGLAYGVGALALALGAWSLADCVRYARSGDAKKATLRLPKRLKLGIHGVIRRGLATRWLVAGSAAVGAAVALLESVCTGQVYLPTLVLMSRVPELRARTTGYLLLYNAAFILPLAAILAAAYFGVGWEPLAKLLRRHLALAKLAMALLFVGLGVLVLVTV